MSTDLAKSMAEKYAMDPLDKHMEGPEDHGVSTVAFFVCGRI